MTSMLLTHAKPTRRLRGHYVDQVPLVVVPHCTPTSISSTLALVPRYKARDVRRLVENVVGLIHQLPRILHSSSISGLRLKDFEVYFGRSSAGPDTGQRGLNVYNRFRDGMRKRGHEYGFIFAEMPISASLRLEPFGLSLIKQLKAVNGLCIANSSEGAPGGVGSCEPGYLYATFQILRTRERAATPSQAQLDRAMMAILNDMRVACASPQEFALMRDTTHSAVPLAGDIAFIGEHRVTLVQGPAD